MFNLVERGEIHMSFQFENKDSLIEFIRKEIITTAEATNILSCSRQYLDELVNKGKIVPVKTINRVRLYWRGDILHLKNK